MVCKNCGIDKFFVTTTGIEVCSTSFCWTPTGYLTEATGRLSTRQIDLEKELVAARGENHDGTRA
jgi:hypothetical protein